MKKIAIIVVLFFSQVALAQPTKLKDIMEKIGEEFKSIAQSIQAGEVSSADLVAVEKLQRLSSEATLIYPFSVSTEAHKIRYLELSSQSVNKIIILEDKIEEALSNDPEDLSEVSPLFFEINELRKEAHDEFKID